MIPFLGLLFSSLNVELKNEILHYVLALVFNQVYISHNSHTKSAVDDVLQNEISCGWELLNIATDIK